MSLVTIRIVFLFLPWFPGSLEKVLCVFNWYSFPQLRLYLTPCSLPSLPPPPLILLGFSSKSYGLMVSVLLIVSRLESFWEVYGYK